MTEYQIQKQNGFTLIEVLVVLSCLIVIGLTIFNIIYDSVISGSIEQGRINLVHDAKVATDAIESDLVLASSYLTGKDSDVSEPYAPSGGWSYTGTSSSSRVLIARVFSTTTNPANGGRQPVFIGNPSDTACNAANLFTNRVESYNIVYFVQNQTLYRRKLVDTATSYCSPGQYQKLSCPSQEDLTAAGLGARNAACQADDEVLAKNVSSFTVDYYPSTSDSTPSDVYASGAEPSLVTNAVDVRVTLQLSQRISGQDVVTSSQLRMSRLNSESEEL